MSMDAYAGLSLGSKIGAWAVSFVNHGVRGTVQIGSYRVNIGEPVMAGAVSGPPSGPGGLISVGPPAVVGVGIGGGIGSVGH